MKRHVRLIRSAVLAACVAMTAFGAAALLPGSQAEAQQLGTPRSGYNMTEVINAGQQFFGTTSGTIAQTIEQSFQQFGLPNGYILGEEAAGAFFGGLRYGEGNLYTKNAGVHHLFWQGPSLGFDIGGDGARTMMLVYDLPSIPAIYGRFGGVTGNAYLVGGVGMTFLKRDQTILVPVKTGLGARLGVNLGYLKITPNPTWNPF